MIDALCRSKLAGIHRLPEHRVEHLQDVLNHIFIGFGQMGEPIAHILGGIDVDDTISTYEIIIKHADHEDTKSKTVIYFVFTKDQIKLMKSKSKVVLERYRAELNDWKKGASFSF